jgi:hypothetical protein
MPGWPDYIINDIPVPAAIELLSYFHDNPQCWKLSVELTEWVVNLQGEVDLAVGQEARTMFPWWRE